MADKAVQEGDYCVAELTCSSVLEQLSAIAENTGLSPHEIAYILERINAVL